MTKRTAPDGRCGILTTAFAFDLVNLKDWAAMSLAGLNAAQILLEFADDIAHTVAERRGDLPYDFDALVKGLLSKP